MYWVNNFIESSNRNIQGVWGGGLIKVFLNMKKSTENSFVRRAIGSRMDLSNGTDKNAVKRK